MINVSNDFRTALKSNKNGYIIQTGVRLTNGTTFTLVNSDLVFDGPVFDDAVCSDNSFGALGGVVINQLSFSINDRNNIYIQYDFTDAIITPKVGILVNGSPVLINKGEYTVDSAVYAANIIRLTALDNMAKFDKPYSQSSLVYPATLETIVRDCCTVCGVTPNISTFPQSTYTVSSRPIDDNITCREVLSWCAQIAGCFCRCNINGQLELKWFNQDAIADYEDIDVDSVAFNPQTAGVFYLKSLFSRTISVDDIIITGLKVSVKGEDSNGDSVIFEFNTGTMGYALDLGENNQFITVDTAPTILNTLGNQIIGLLFRSANLDHVSDPTIEAGDVAIVKDRMGNAHPILITRTTFSATSKQITVSAAETPSKNSATRFSELTKSYVEARKLVKREKTARELVEADLLERIGEASGLYCTEVPQQDGSVITYLHNQPLLEDSDIRIMISSVGITVTADGGEHWYGLTVDGNLIASIISAIGINADWINTGIIRSTNGDNYWNLDTGELHIVSEAVDFQIGAKNLIRHSEDWSYLGDAFVGKATYADGDGIKLSDGSDLMLTLSNYGTKEIGPNIRSLNITFLQTDTIKAGDSLDSLRQYITATLLYWTGTSVGIYDYTLSGELNSGQNTITVSFGDVSQSIEVTAV